MNTRPPLLNDNDLTCRVDALKPWPGIAIDDGEFPLWPRFFLTFYLHYLPDQSLRTTLDMLDVQDAFARLLGHPYTIATHPRSERLLRYGSIRLEELHEWARRCPVDQVFTVNLTDQDNHQISPGHSAYLRREPAIAGKAPYYSSLQFYFCWQWWLDHQHEWRQFVLESIAYLAPAQVYSGFAVANPLGTGMRSQAAVLNRALAPHFYGLDIDHPPGMMRAAELPSGIRPPTWGFFLSDIWREKLGTSRDEVAAQLADPLIRIEPLDCGLWIELGPRPELYPVQQGMPRLPAVLNRLLHKIRHPQLDLLGSCPRDVEPGKHFDSRDTRRWLARFDDGSDWPTRKSIIGTPPGY